MADFNVAHRFTAKWEGGISNHANDTGGFTAYGVSTAFITDMAKNKAYTSLLRSLDLLPPYTQARMRTITPAKAAAIFQACFWDRLDLDIHTQALATTIYDAAVNCGINRSLKLAQKAANITGPSNLTVDGILGPKSRAAFLNADPQKLAQENVRQRINFYNSLVQAKPSQKVFLKGWLNRANALSEFIKKMA